MYNQKVTSSLKDNQNDVNNNTVENTKQYVYCLATVETPLRTYIGATVDLERRLRQHNGELKGGARRTSVRPGGWYRVCYVSGFKTWQEALQFEWRWKFFSRSRVAGKVVGPLEQRQAALELTLAWWAEKKGGVVEVVAGEDYDTIELI